jgi:hypothetical protein
MAMIGLKSKIFIMKNDGIPLIKNFVLRLKSLCSGSFYRKIILSIFFTERILTEKSVGQMPFGRTPFDRKII